MLFMASKTLHRSPRLFCNSLFKAQCTDHSLLSQPTLWWEGDARAHGCVSKKGKCAESPPSIIRGKRRKNRRKTGQKENSKFGSCIYT